MDSEHCPLAPSLIQFGLSSANRLPSLTPESRPVWIGKLEAANSPRNKHDEKQGTTDIHQETSLEQRRKYQCGLNLKSLQQGIRSGLDPGAAETRRPISLP
ncbi:hypothetical protein CCM_02850 [Cordyceps militaris CM01]|uniref:Uncharacterized protein n=1 Tax=Cordyceps militaris (strain CM01) TaxID=983644 RepID=G3JC64_CORMM|nr:uncharacterized protein CCM_02850 [Cordyceps militaris CM01]EGX94579.1 hypothetical protein CCM_02850 [Cordyceps militaris CM01]